MNHIVRDLTVLALISLAAASGLEGQPASPHRINGGTFEASAVVHVPGSDGVLFVDDGQTRQVFWMELSPEGTQTSRALPVPLMGVDVVDLEGLTTDGHYFYAVGSQSKKTGFDGDGLVRFTFDPATRKAGGIESIRGLKRFLSQHVAELDGVENRVGDAALNIEGLAWDSREGRLLLALRAPIVDGHALVIPLKLRDVNGPFAAGNLTVDGQRAIRIPTSGAGVRSIEFDPQRDRFVVITGAALNAENADFRLLEWDGRDGSPLDEVRQYSRKLKPEGITRAEIAGRESTVIVFDTGLYEVFP
jgi:hypothetical protein